MQLSENKGEIVENKSLMDNLRSSSRVFDNLKYKEEELNTLNAKLSEKRDLFRNGGKRAAVLYLCISNL